jgi:hypothetical protein
MQYLRHVDVFIKFCLLGALIGLTVVVYQSTGELSSSVKTSSKAIEDEIRGLKQTLNVTQIKVLLKDIQSVLIFISEQQIKQTSPDQT